MRGCCQTTGEKGFFIHIFITAMILSLFYFYQFTLVCVDIQQLNIMEELLRRAGAAGLMDAWQSELQELLANLTASTRQPAAATSRRRKLFFQLQNCIDVCHETNRVSYVVFVV